MKVFKFLWSMFKADKKRKCQSAMRKIRKNEKSKMMKKTLNDFGKLVEEYKKTEAA